jgi:hypothetical protein
MKHVTTILAISIVPCAAFSAPSRVYGRSGSRFSVPKLANPKLGKLKPRTATRLPLCFASPSQSAPLLALHILSALLPNRLSYASSGVEPHAYDYTSAINACGDDVSTGLSILEDMRSKLGNSSKLGTLHAVTAAVTVCGKGRRPDLALQLFDTLEEPDVSAYSAALQALARSKSGPEAEKLLLRMAQHARTPANAACGKTATCADAPYIAPTPDLGCLNAVFMAYLRMATSLSSSSGSSPRELGSGNDSSSSSAWQHAYDLLANSAVKIGVAPDAYSYALVAETGMLCGACSEAKHLYCEARRQFAHQVRLLDDLETKLWKVWSHKVLSEGSRVCVCVCVCVCEEMY